MLTEQARAATLLAGPSSLTVVESTRQLPLIQRKLQWKQRDQMRRAALMQRVHAMQMPGALLTPEGQAGRRMRQAAARVAGWSQGRLPQR